MSTPTGVEDYLAQFTGELRGRLDTTRRLIKSEAPKAVESFSYGLVGYKLNGKPLVYFGGFKQHVGFYATPNGHDEFKEAFAQYRQGKGSVQFPLDKPLPDELIKRVTAFRMTMIGAE